MRPSSPPSTHSAPDRFTLGQALLVFVTAGVLAHAGSRYIVQPLRAKAEAAGRQQLLGDADAALQVLGSDLRAASPRGMRIDPSGLQLELHTANQPTAVRLVVAQFRVGLPEAALPGSAAPIALTYLCDLSQGTLTRYASNLATGAFGALPTVKRLASGVTACRFSRGPQSQVQLMLTLTAPSAAGRTSVTRLHELPVGSAT